MAVRTVNVASPDAAEVGETSDLELVRRSKKGDTDAFSVLVLRHQQLVFNLSYRFMRDVTVAEDMAQEAFIKAYRMLSGFRGDCSFSTWLYRVTASVCLSELNRRKRRTEVTDAASADAASATWQAAHGQYDVAPAADASDLSELIRRCVTKLPERYAAIINLYYLKEMPYEEIRRALRVPAGTLKTWMHRARNQLRKIMEKELAWDDLV